RFPLLRPDRPIACPRPRPFSPSLCHSHRPARRPLRQSLRPSAPVPHLTTGLRQSWTSELLSRLPAPVLIGSFPSPCLNVSILFGCGRSAYRPAPPRPLSSGRLGLARQKDAGSIRLRSPTLWRSTRGSRGRHKARRKSRSVDLGSGRAALHIAR